MTTKILDSTGSPYPVTKVDGKRPLTNEIAAAANDIYLFQGWLQVIENPDEVLNLEAHGDLTVYDRIGRDPRVASNLRTRAKAVTGREWQMVPFSQEPDDIKAAEYAQKVFSSFAFDRARRSILRGSILKGFSVGEIMWDYSEGDTFIKDIHYRHQRRFKFDPDGHLHLLTLDNPYPGVNVTINPATGLPLRKFQVVTFGDEVTTPYGVGLGHELYWPWWFKKNGIKYWLLFCDKFAGPTVKGEYEAGTPPDKQAELLSAAQAVHSNSAVIYPKGMSLELMEAARSGTVNTYKDLCDFMNDEITIAILGQTATTTGKPGALGDADEQSDVRSDYLKDDADSLCEAFNSRDGGAIRWLIDYQFPNLRRHPQMWIKVEDEQDGKTLAERDKNLSDALDKSGLKLTRSYYVRTHGLEKDDLEEAKRTEEPNKPLTHTPDKEDLPEKPAEESGEVEFAEPADRRIANPPPPDNADILADRLMDEARPYQEKWLSGLKDETDKAGNLVDLRRDILDAPVDIAPMAEIIRDGLLLGHLLGRAEVLDEINEGAASFAEPATIADALRLPFAEAIAFFRDKVNIPTEKWNDLFLDAHSRGFMIAGAMKGDLLNDLRQAIDEVISQGLTLREFRQQWDDIVERHGWSYVGGRNWRTRVVYETNVRQSYNAGRWQQMTDPDVIKARPYLLYKHGDSVHPRVLHLGWDGTVLPADDPWFDTHSPQNGWGCKCKLFSANERDIARLGDNAKRSAPKDGSYTWTDKQGRSFDIPNGIDPGFQYNPGKAAGKSRDILNDRISQLPPDIAARIRTEIAEKS